MRFEFATAGRILAGPGRAADLPAVLAGLGDRVLVCTGANPLRHNALIGELGLAAALFPVAGEPSVDLARAAADAARRHGADVIAAIGGGSVIDTAKAVAMLLGNGGDPLDYLEVIGAGQPITQPSVPCVAVPTTAGTGAEVTANAVLAVPAHRVKASLRSPLMIPRVALVDPELTVSCPAPVTAASGLDALTQCLEPFVSVRASPLTDGLAREGLRRAAAGLRAAYADGTDLAARTDMAMCSLLGGLALANAKLGAVHGLAGVIGGTADVPHGFACAARAARGGRGQRAGAARRAGRRPGAGPLRRSGPAAGRRPRPRRSRTAWPGSATRSACSPCPAWPASASSPARPTTSPRPRPGPAACKATRSRSPSPPSATSSSSPCNPRSPQQPQQNAQRPRHVMITSVGRCVA